MRVGRWVENWVEWMAAMTVGQKADQLDCYLAELTAARMVGSTAELTVAWMV